MFQQRALGALLLCGQAEAHPEQGVEERSAVTEGLEVAMPQGPQVNWVAHSQENVEAYRHIINFQVLIIRWVLAFQEEPIVAGDVEEVCEGVKEAVRGG